uniref:Secreted protein n=1 Tax=Panagrellus redivivus TaxID=6233 RepID=A0A7E4VKD5_PANRE
MDSLDPVGSASAMTTTHPTCFSIVFNDATAASRTLDFLTRSSTTHIFSCPALCTTSRHASTVGHALAARRLTHLWVLRST